MKTITQIIMAAILVISLATVQTARAQAPAPQPAASALGQSITLKFSALDGRTVDLASLKGKVVLVDCWATWCGPCVKEMPHIKEIYDKYHDKGFEVIGISMDDVAAKERALKIIKDNHIPWPQRFEGKGFNDDSFRKQYQVKSLPTVYLLDKDGKVVDTNARAERLEPLLKQYLGLEESPQSTDHD